MSLAAFVRESVVRQFLAAAVSAFGASPWLPVSYRCNRSAACFTMFRGSSANAR
jgi:hypothetical protein